jgi:diaminopimelate decarboxylase
MKNPQPLTINNEIASAIFQEALKLEWIRPEDALVQIQDLDVLEKRIRHLQSLFPPEALHAIAIKCNPLHEILKFIRTVTSSGTNSNQSGIGLEAATIGEVVIALKAGFPPEKIVFDSPVKTESDLLFAMTRGVYINCDNLDELKRVDKLLKTTLSSSSFGIRINPQVGIGTIEESSVAGVYSKFGVPLGQQKETLQEAFLTYPWLTGVHLHVGSQGCGLDLLVEGVKRVGEFAQDMNRLRLEHNLPPVKTLDIGGGLPVHYVENDKLPTLEEYVKALKPILEEVSRFGLSASHIPHLTSLITEFGRWVFVPSGFTVSRVEYVKHDPGITTLMIHAGADLFVRECLSPAPWKHTYALLDRHGNLKHPNVEKPNQKNSSPGQPTHKVHNATTNIQHKNKGLTPCNLAGPLCFAGDIVAKNVMLPQPEEGDYLIIHDTGGYTFSMWSRYNSRQTPRILGYKEGVFSILKERETPEETCRFWE